MDNSWLIRSKNGPIIIKHHPTLDVWCLSNGMLLTSKDTPRGCTGTHPVKFKSANCPDRGGYYRFHVNGKTRKIHRLIAETFIENSMNKPSVDHIDRNRTNNDVSNLRWADYVEQQHNTVCHDRVDNLYGVHTYEDLPGYKRRYMHEYMSRPDYKKKRADYRSSRRNKKQKEVA